MSSFYKQLQTLMEKHKNVTVQTVIAGNEKLLGQKIAAAQEEVVFCDDGLIGLPQEALNSLTFFAETIVKKPRLVICGGGHIALCLYKIAETVGFSVTVIDERQQFASNARFENAKTVCKPYQEALSEAGFDENNYYVIVTNSHLSDRACLEAILKNSYAYVGMVGSKRKISLVLNKLRDVGFTEEVLSKIHTPIGLNIHAETPEEIAISILAEIISVKNKAAQISANEEIFLACQNENALAVLTITQTKGSAARKAGSKMVVFKDETIMGTIGGGSAEHEVLQKSIEACKNNTSALVTCQMLNEDVTKGEMICGGEIQVFIEVLNCIKE